LFRGSLGWETWRQTDPENINDTRWTENVYEPQGRFDSLLSSTEDHDDQTANERNSQTERLVYRVLKERKTPHNTVVSGPLEESVRLMQVEQALELQAEKKIDDEARLGTWTKKEQARIKKLMRGK
jgi:hypothetical protein